MKSIIFLLVIVIAGISDSYSQKLIDLKIYYHDTITVAGKDSYRLLTQVGEDPHWAKPETIDIVLHVSGASKSSKERIEIMIEELYEPTELSNFTESIRKATWVPHVVVYSGNTNFVKEGKITVSNFPYKTAYFKSSLLYVKKGFRIIGFYYNLENKKTDRIAKEIHYGM